MPRELSRRLVRRSDSTELAEVLREGGTSRAVVRRWPDDGGSPPTFLALTLPRPNRHRVDAVAKARWHLSTFWPGKL